MATSESGSSDGGTSPVNGKRHRGLRSVLSMIAFVAAVLASVIVAKGLSSPGPSSPPARSSSTTDTTSKDPESVREETRQWLAAHGGLIDRFDAATRALTRSDDTLDCTGLAEALHADLGPLNEFLKQMSATPDPVLSELLVSSAIAARGLLSACQTNDGAAMREEREALDVGLQLIAQRRTEMRGPR